MLNHTAARRPLASQTHGVATLTVVMVLFFVMALVAAYTNRNLIFEQRISLGNFRSARAAEAAEASVNWALSLLNGGRVNSQCLASVDPVDTDFRQMFSAVPGPTQYAPAGSYALPPNQYAINERVWGCVIADGVARCACPTTSVPNPTIARPLDNKGSAFHVTMYLPETGGSPMAGTLGLLGFACGSLGDGNNDCSRSVGLGGKPQADGVSGVSQVVGLLRALPLAPQATLTVGGAVNGGTGNLQVTNRDSSSGYTVLSGLDYTAGTGPSGNRFHPPAGTEGEARQHNIIALNTLANQANGGWFRNLFAMDLVSYGLQPAAQVIDCTAGCTATRLNTVLLGFPRNPIILNGSVNIDSAVALGSATDPALLVINGTLTITANATITGFIHANSVAWNAATATLSGAMMTPGNFTIGAGGVATMSFDKPVIDKIKYRYGSFVRVPGSWNVREFYR